MYGADLIQQGTQHSPFFPHTLARVLNRCFTSRWRLLSHAIDHTCRWVFVIAYVTTVVATAVSLVTQSAPVPKEFLEGNVTSAYPGR